MYIRINIAFYWRLFCRLYCRLYSVLYCRLYFKLYIALYWRLYRILYYIKLYCRLYWIVLYCIVLLIVLYCIVLYCIVFVWILISYDRKKSIVDFIFQTCCFSLMDIFLLYVAGLNLQSRNCKHLHALKSLIIGTSGCVQNVRCLFVSIAYNRNFLNCRA